MSTATGPSSITVEQAVSFVAVSDSYYDSSQPDIMELAQVNVDRGYNTFSKLMLQVCQQTQLPTCFHGDVIQDMKRVEETNAPAFVWVLGSAHCDLFHASNSSFYSARMKNLDGTERFFIGRYRRDDLGAHKWTLTEVTIQGMAAFYSDLLNGRPSATINL